MSAVRRRRQRGYALLIVLLVLMLLAMAVGSLATLLEATIAEGRKTTATIRADLACGSALDLSARTVTKALTADPSLGPAELVAALCALGPCVVVGGETLPEFLAPPGSKIEHFAIAYSTTKGRTTRTIPDGPFRDRIAVEQTLLVTVGLRDVITNRSCAAMDRYLVPSLPLTSVALFGAAPTTRWKPPLGIRRLNDGAPSRAHLNGNTAGAQISPSDFVLPGPQFAGDPQPIDLVNSTRGKDQVLAPSVGTPAMSSKQSSLPRSLRWLIEPPRTTDSEALNDARLAEIADVVVIDGVWYNHRDKTKPWPGTPIWSDHGGSGVGHVAPANAIVVDTSPIGQGDFGFVAGEVPTLYSWYDRSGPTTTIAPQNSGGILSYGPLAVESSSTGCTTDADCAPSFECLRVSSSTGTCQRLEPGFWPAFGTGCGDDLKRVGECGNPGNSIIDGSRGGFRDKGRNIWPININLEVLAAALTSTAKHELGFVLGGPTFFNGVIYITGRFNGSSLPEPKVIGVGTGPAPTCTIPLLGPGTCAVPSFDSDEPRSSNTVPVGLCGLEPLSTSFGAAPCVGAGRPNAVRLYNGGRLPAGAFPHGLTIATDLPLYVQGDLNRVQAGTPPPAHVKVAVVADRVTFLSRGWRDANHPWNRGTLSSPPSPPTGTMVVEASIVTGMPLHGGGIHDVGDLFRTPQDFAANHFVLRGHLIAGFNSELDDRDASDARVDDGLRWLPDYHLDNPGFQPPGMPLLTLPPTTRWRQRP